MSDLSDSSDFEINEIMDLVKSPVKSRRESFDDLLLENVESE